MDASVAGAAARSQIVRFRLIALGTAFSLLAGCAARTTSPKHPLDPAVYADLLRRAEVWQPTRVRAMNLREGPRGPGAFKPNQSVNCTYVQRDFGGNTPKFACVLPDGDELRVKYGRENGEVFAEVAASRLLWALGFGTDRVYPVRVFCRGCPPLGDAAHDPVPSNGTTEVEFATVERKMPGREVEGPKGSGWSWKELDEVGPRATPEAIARRDALKLLAVLLQHTDSKREQQRLVCLGSTRKGADSCKRPFLLIGDLGKTFGKANMFNRDKPGSVDLEAWARMPVWAERAGCKANLPKSLTGTLDNPTITEAGRKFLARLLAQLTDAQLYDLFEVARFPARAHGDDAISGEVRAWVAAFKRKVDEVRTRSCEGALAP